MVRTLYMSTIFNIMSGSIPETFIEAGTIPWIIAIWVRSLPRQASAMSLKPPRESLLNCRNSTTGLFFFLFYHLMSLKEMRSLRHDLILTNPCRLLKDPYSIFFLSVQNRYFNDRFWSLDPEQCQSHYRVSEPTTPFEALGGTPPVSHVSVPAVFLGGIYVECLDAASGLFI